MKETQIKRQERDWRTTRSNPIKIGNPPRVFKLTHHQNNNKSIFYKTLNIKRKNKLST